MVAKVRIIGVALGVIIAALMTARIVNWKMKSPALQLSPSGIIIELMSWAR